MIDYMIGLQRNERKNDDEGKCLRTKESFGEQKEKLQGNMDIYLLCWLLFCMGPLSLPVTSPHLLPLYIHLKILKTFCFYFVVLCTCIYICQ